MFREKIELVLVKRQMSKSDLAKQMGMTTQNLYRNLKRDNFSEDDMRKIAETLNCDLDVSMILRDTHEKF